MQPLPTWPAWLCEVLESALSRGHPNSQTSHVHLPFLFLVSRRDKEDSLARERLDSLRLVSLGTDEFSVVRKTDKSVPTWAFAHTQRLWLSLLHYLSHKHRFCSRIGTMWHGAVFSLSFPHCSVLLCWVGAWPQNLADVSGPKGLALVFQSTSHL